MAQLEQQKVSEQELAGRWVAVDQHAQARGLSGLSYLPTGAVLVDYDSELDLLCQRVAASGMKRLTIFKYEGLDAESGFRPSRGSA
jgi:hypothetical protein